MLKSFAESSESKQNGGAAVTMGRLRQKLDNEYRYNREEMLRIAKCELSLKRPADLSTEFDNENGKFQPDKWLEHCWVCEGIENRPNANPRRKEKIKPEVLDGNSTVLSPQRRGFSSGCRAASPHRNEAEPERLGANKGNWRSGAGFMLKNSSATNDFKPSFQKNSGGSGAENSFTRNRQGSNADRRAAGDAGFKSIFHKDAQSQNRNRLLSSMSTEEKVPEWMEEGPTSMHDMIELKGFDEERKNVKRGSGNKSRKDVSAKQHVQQKLGAGKSSVANRLEASVAQIIGNKGKGAAVGDSKPSSHGSSCTSPTVEKSEKTGISQTSKVVGNLSTSKSDTAIESALETPVIPPPLLNSKLPNSDAEFAAIMGLLDANDFEPLKENPLSSASAVPGDPAPCSRLSRFFSTTNKKEARLIQQNVETGDSNNNEGSAAKENESTAPSNSLLRKIFASSQSSSPMPPEQPVATSLPGVVHAEDLEKGFQWEAARGAVAPPSTSSASEHFRQLGISPHSSSTSRLHQITSYQVSKGNPLGDPQQQAQLMNKLNKFARQQDLSSTEEITVRANTAGSPLLSQHMSLSSGKSSSCIGELPRFRSAPQDVAMQTAILRSQLDAAFMKNLQYASQQRPALMQSQPTDVSAIRAMLANLMASNNASHTGASSMVAVSSSGAPQSRNQTTTVSNAFMPTSVMRQMTKNNVSVDEKSRKVKPSASGLSQSEDEKHKLVNEDVPQKQADYVRGYPPNLNGNSPDVMSKLLQQQYMQTMAAMRSGVQPTSWNVPPHMLPQWRAQAFAASQAEQQHLYTLAMLRNDINQAQAIRARILSQQAAAGLLNVSAPASSIYFQHDPQTVIAGQQTPYGSGNVSQVPVTSAQGLHKYQSPLEKLLQSAGVPTKQAERATSQDKQQGNTGMPSIVSRLPPQANCIIVEDLEKQYASN